jgi:hypothetical protein
VAVADVVGGANLEIIVTDMAGNVVCVDTEGEVVWDRRCACVCICDNISQVYVCVYIYDNT